MKSFYLNVNNSGFSESNDTIINDLYEMFKARELEQFLVYQVIAYVFGAIIFLSNLTVVISSGLLLKKDQHRKITYLLLGNLSLSDTFVGLFIIIANSIENPMSNNPLCIFQTGILICAAIVSKFTVGLIAVDRYIYILHGLYYQKWFTTTRVRIGILCIWVIGITLAFMPASGWVNTELKHSRCHYVSLFPGALILLNTFLCIVPIVLVVVLYSIILIRALKNVKEIKATIKNVSTNLKDNKLKIHIGGDDNLKKFAQTVKYPAASKDIKIHRTASFNENYTCNRVKPEISNISRKSKSIENLNENITFGNSKIEIKNNRSSCDSEFSIYSISSRTPEVNSSVIEIGVYKNNKSKFKSSKQKNILKVKEPNKWRAIIVVMLTSGSFIITWMPCFIALIFYVFCQEKFTNLKCMHLRMMLSGPIASLAFSNSLINPMIYAWWHKGFQRNIRICFRRYVWHFFQNVPF